MRREITPLQVDSIVFAVERRIGALPGTTRKVSRTKETLRVRQVVFYVLNMAGMSTAALGRNFGMDHSTVGNALVNAEASLNTGTWWQDVRYIAAKVLSGGQRTVFNFRLERALGALEPAEQRAVVLYANGPLLGWERNNPQQEAYGLTVIARDSRARYALEQALRVAELDSHIARVDMQVCSMERKGHVNYRS